MDQHVSRLRENAYAKGGDSVMKFDGRIRADARALPLADESVQCVVTSPPYFGLRDYGHAGQIGIEKTPYQYVNAMLSVFDEVWRVLKSDGTLWLNLGDSYAGSWGAGSRGKEYTEFSSLQGGSMLSARINTTLTGSMKNTPGLKPKDLIGIPWKVAFALQAQGWYLRSDIIWAKPNPMPESVTDRPTRSHEYVFLLTKSERYFYNASAIKEPGIYAGPNARSKTPHGQGFSRRAFTDEKVRQDKQRGHSRRHDGFNDRWDAMEKSEQCSVMRNKRDVWTIGTAPYPDAHYAVFPAALIEPCVLAGSRPGDFILDPFAGSGTVAMVAEKHSRRGISIDLGYQDLQAKRMRNLQKVLTPISIQQESL